MFSIHGLQPCAVCSYESDRLAERLEASVTLCISSRSRRTTEKADVLVGGAVRRCLLHALGFLGSALRGGGGGAESRRGLRNARWRLFACTSTSVHSRA